MKKLLSALLVVGLAGSAFAGTPDAAAMKAMQAEMMKCTVCKHMAAKMDAIGPMTHEVVFLDNGIAMGCELQDASKLPVYRATSAEMHKAGGECMTMTDADAKTKLCPMCQEIRSAAKRGAMMSMGETKNGSLMVLASADPAVQKDLKALGEKCAMMSGGGAKDAHAGHGH